MEAPRLNPVVEARNGSVTTLALATKSEQVQMAKRKIRFARSFVHPPSVGNATAGPPLSQVPGAVVAVVVVLDWLPPKLGCVAVLRAPPPAILDTVDEGRPLAATSRL